MARELEIKERVYNIAETLRLIKEMPQTYQTILGSLKVDVTLKKILNRKLNKELKRGNVCKTSIPGTRFGKAIFYNYSSNYNILIKQNRKSVSEVYCFDKYNLKDEFYVSLTDYWILESHNWVKGKEEVIIFDGDILKWI